MININKITNILIVMMTTSLILLVLGVNPFFKRLASFEKNMISKTIIDRYTFTYISHGIILRNIFNVIKLENIYALFVAECAWKIFQNMSDPSDNLLNSMADILVSSIGWSISSYFTKKGNIVLLLLLEICSKICLNEIVFLNIYVLIEHYQVMFAYDISREAAVTIGTIFFSIISIISVHYIVFYICRIARA